MQDKDIQLIQDSFAKVKPIADQAAEIFYSKLFEIDPNLKNLFRNSDMKAQGKKLMATLGVVVAGLRNLESIVPVAQQLAVKHLDYGVKSEHYTAVGNALLRTLAAGLGDDFTPETREAWVKAYKILADVMREAAYGKA